MIYLFTNLSQSFFVYRKQSREKWKKKKIQKKSLLRKRGSGGLNKKTERRHFNNSYKEGPHNVNKKAC